MKYILISICFCFLLILGLYLLCPKPMLLENFSFSSVLYDKNGHLMRISLSSDEKYRIFTPIQNIPENAKKALLMYEDKNFEYHIGLDLKAFFRAAYVMLSGGKKQGASTITMQVARLIYNIDSTTIQGKIKQILIALQLERHYSKSEILEAYFNLAPYGDNIEGLGAAALIYFKTPIEKLTLPEILSLISIPQNPVHRNPIRQYHSFETARQRLIKQWVSTYPDEPQNEYLSLPLSVYSRKEIPFFAPHLTTRLLQTHTGTIHTTIDLFLQQHLENTVKHYISRNQSKNILNASVLILNYETMEIISYIGSADFWNTNIDGQVDGVRASRSPGSAMKPFIYALGLEQGLIHPLTLVKDIPSQYALYEPENFDRHFNGMVSATDALIHSLNIPAVDLLSQLKDDAFFQLLKQGNVRALKNRQNYGLSLALGGFEISLEEIVAFYASLANGGILKPIHLTKEESLIANKQILLPESAFLTKYMLSQTPPVDGYTSYPVSWKTGTSYGYKDAWSIGIVGPYVIGVWIGHFNGTGNPAFIGRTAAAPLLFEIIRNLEKKEHFKTKEPDISHLNLAYIDICATSGDIADKLCDNVVKSWFIPGVSPIKLSGIHRQIPINKTTGLRACRHTPPLTTLQTFEFWPSEIQNIFHLAGIIKKTPPPFENDCLNDIQQSGQPPQIVYPNTDLVQIIQASKKEKATLTLKASTDTDATKIYWFLNNKLHCISKPNEPCIIPIQSGQYDIKAIDDLGRESIKRAKIETVQ